MPSAIRSRFTVHDRLCDEPRYFLESDQNLGFHSGHGNPDRLSDGCYGWGSGRGSRRGSNGRGRPRRGEGENEENTKGTRGTREIPRETAGLLEPVNRTGGGFGSIRLSRENLLLNSKLQVLSPPHRGFPLLDGIVRSSYEGLTTPALPRNGGVLHIGLNIFEQCAALHTDESRVGDS